MAQKQVTVRMRLASSRFTAGLRRVGAAVQRVAARVRRMGSSLAAAMKAAISHVGVLTAGLLGIGGALAVLHQVRAFIKLGADLDHMGKQTGLAAGKLLVLKQAFDDAGADGENVGKTINKMQKALVDGKAGVATYVRAFARIGLTVQELEGLAPEKQFERIIDAMRKTPNEANRAAAAMDIFGRAGPEIMPLVMNPNAIEDAKAALGGLPDAMDRMAHIMERIDTIFGRLKMKVFQFLLPLVENFLVQMQVAMENLNRLDLAEAGKRFAKFVLTLVNIIKAGKLGELLTNSIVVGLTKGLAKVIPLFEAVFKAIAKTLVSVLAEALAGIVNNLPAPLRNLLGLGDGNVKGAALAKPAAAAIDKIDFGAIAKGLDAAGKPALQALKDLFAQHGKNIVLNKVTDPSPEHAPPQMEPARNPFRLIADSFRRIGAGGRAIGGVSLDQKNFEEQKKHTGFMARMAKALEGRRVAVGGDAFAAEKQKQEVLLAKANAIAQEQKGILNRMAQNIQPPKVEMAGGGLFNFAA